MLSRAFYLVIFFLIAFPVMGSHIENNDSLDWHVPLKYVVNGTFDVSQNDNWFSQKDFYQKNKLVWERVTNPISNIKKDGGFGKFFKDEFISDRSIPNYLLHTIGGAYDGHWLSEYFFRKDFEYPYLYAILTSYFARWGNEVLEAGNENISSHDHIADLFFFDSLGLILSRNEGFMRFLVEDMGMRAFHSIPFYDPLRDDFFNSGLNYILRPKILGIGDNLRPFFYFGMQNIGGISYYKNDEIFSLGTGIFLTEPLKRKMRVVSSFFYEKDNRLLFSAFLNGSEGYRWRLNFYPNFLQFSKNCTLSMMIGEKRNHYDTDYGLGINLNMPFGMGVN